MKVDIDKTDFGHMVGEVEAVLYDSDNADEMQVQIVKEKIMKLVDHIRIRECEITDDDESMIAIGKLEYYLMNNRRDHYDACLKAGVI